jgi:hypothetical protein
MEGQDRSLFRAFSRTGMATLGTMDTMRSAPQLPVLGCQLAVGSPSPSSSNCCHRQVPMRGRCPALSLRQRLDVKENRHPMDDRKRGHSRLLAHPSNLMCRWASGSSGMEGPSMGSDPTRPVGNRLDHRRASAPHMRSAAFLFGKGAPESSPRWELKLTAAAKRSFCNLHL